MHLTKPKRAPSHLSNLNRVIPRYSVRGQLAATLKASLFTPALGFSDEAPGTVTLWGPTALLVPAPSCPGCMALSI